MHYGLIDITDWIFLFFGRNEKKFRVQKKKKNGRKTAIKFSESARFLPVGRPTSNKHLFIFGLNPSYIVQSCLKGDFFFTVVRLSI